MENCNNSNHSDSNQPKDVIPSGTLCELCGMLAVATTTDEHGVVHFWCSHHVPAGSNSSVEHGARSMDANRATNSILHTTADHGHDRHEGHSTNMFRDRFWICLILTIPIVVLADFFQKLLGYSINFNGMNFTSLILGTIIFFYGGSVFVKSALGEIKAKLPGMMTLIALAITAAYLYSISIVLGLLKGGNFFWELATLITIMLLGHWLEMKAVSGAQNSLGELAKLLPDTAELIQNSNINNIPIAELKIGDVVLIRPGAKVSADGVIMDGESDINEAMLTGESKPVAKKIGNEVIAGSVNVGSGALTIKITKIGKDTALAGIMRLVAEAQKSKSKAQIIADKAAFILTFIAVGVGIITISGWLIAGAGLAFAIERLVSVLVIACPHALGLAVPLVTSISTSISAKNGLLVKNRLALESARNIDIVLFDKTGTLTKGEMGVTEIIALNNFTKDKMLEIAGTLEQHSEHSIGKAIIYELKTKSILSSRARVEGKLKTTVKNLKIIKGQGVQGEISGKQYYIGGPKLIESLKINAENIKDIDTLSKQGRTVVYVIEVDKVIGVIAIADQIRQESKEAVQAIHNFGVKTAMVTGDSWDVANAVAQEIGIDKVFAQVLPGEKVEIIKKLQNGNINILKFKILNLKSGRLSVAFVGDGVNDAPSLIQADVGIAIGAGTDVAIESAGIILVKDDPRAVVKIFTLSKATYNKMVQNLWWAAGYNIIAIPLATGFFGIALNPAVAAILMSMSTVIVAFNAQLLRRVRL